jgi:hypothetical protein
MEVARPLVPAGSAFWVEETLILPGHLIGPARGGIDISAPTILARSGKPAAGRESAGPRLPILTRNRNKGFSVPYSLKNAGAGNGSPGPTEKGPAKMLEAERRPVSQMHRSAGPYRQVAVR